MTQLLILLKFLLPRLLQKSPGVSVVKDGEEEEVANAVSKIKVEDDDEEAEDAEEGEEPEAEEGEEDDEPSKQNKNREKRKVKSKSEWLCVVVRK